METTAEHGFEIEVDDDQVLGKLLTLDDQVSFLVEDERVAVEQELVLPADQVGVA